MSIASTEPCDERISYAQNREDIILSRIFANEAKGFYVDIGACHPIYDSVTQHFYLRGWHGINIEPQPLLFAELQRERTRDTNLNLCVGRQSGRQTLYITEDQGTSTLENGLASHYQSTGRVIQEIDVEVVSLNEIWLKYVGTQRVDFLKIDVEGFEKEVLLGANFAVVNPSILLIEAVHPESLKPTHQDWEPLIAKHYCLFYCDGLNRFYYRKDFPLSLPECSTPPNVFDRFKSYHEHLAEQACKHLAQQLEANNLQIANFEQLLSQKDAALQHAAHAYEELQREIKNFKSLLEQKDAALQDAAEAYKEIRRQFDEQQSGLGQQVKT
ncbi:FkbM family methyltransferase [Pseudomonas sp. J452]|uniref:FkbM family methyltransferase n=1 Tax=Pseudomonas sp. J452 TaxID=2898441 RepID=UPI0021ADA5D3|nr:FkbM family methyltransferase [Pseudomonas sp. J452]UUY09843.1 FkbM family methyltransferase [Pseudomonas sp. J452]